MKSLKQLGIWMDHSTAHLMELSNGIIITNTIESKSEPNENEENVLKDESHMLNKEQRRLSTYFKKLADVIKDYENVVLFGPTDAKKELYNYLKNSRHFETIEIELKPADKMTENQMQAFVKDYFKKAV
jgi:stalled ribosome rescue protein Dom34